MAKLLDEEEECQDEFYVTNYGGFQDTASDNEYEYAVKLISVNEKHIIVVVIEWKMKEKI